MFKRFLILFVVIFLAWPILSYSATVGWYAVDDKTMALVLDTEGQSLNTLSGEIDVSKTDFKNISDANSLVNFWLEEPKESQGKIIFSGIIPGGFLGEGVILTLNFSEKTAINSLKINKLTAFLNDGQGQEAKVLIKNQIAISDNLKNIFVEKKNVVAPEKFEPQVVRDSNFPTNDYYLVFGTQDKGSGLAYYAVYESRWPVNVVKKNSRLDWVRADSPFLLKDQHLKSLIYVKAVNQNGGVRIVKLSPQFSLVWWYEHWLFSFIIMVITIVFFRYIYFRF